MPRLQEARAGQRAVYFVDASHFVYSAFRGLLWCLVRVFLHAPVSRQRLTVLGALNAVTHDLVMLTTTASLTASSVCQLLRRLADLHLGIPLTVVLDNARYQTCQVVKDVAAELQIELLYLPPYSPNLNLMERLWKFVKKQCLYSRYYPDFESFRGAIMNW